MTQSDQVEPRKLAYQKPVIKVFGSVVTLTASGTGQNNESDTNGGNVPRPQPEINAQLRRIGSTV